MTAAATLLAFTLVFLAAGSSVQTALKFLGHPRQMPMHCCASGRGIVRRDRAHNGCVVANRLLGKIVGVKVLLHPSPEFRPLIPKSVDHQLERTVARRLGQSQVEVAITVLAYSEVVDVCRHSLDTLA